MPISISAFRTISSKFCCIDCFHICRTASEFVYHKSTHLQQRPRLLGSPEWLELRADMILDAEYTYYFANLQPIGLCYDGPDKEEYVQATIAKVFSVERPTRDKAQVADRLYLTKDRHYKAIPVFNRTY